ncbi:MAG TPA: hypothetical protein VJM74_02860 [Nitrososphaeraceae archaeon]|nr:hypothetical protein [Nitrososphaeraceae archaeon]
MKSYFFTLVILLTLTFSFLLGNVVSSRVMAESGVGKDVFKIVVSLYGITDSTKDIITIATVGDQTKVKLHNAGNSTSDKVSYVFSFPGLSVVDGEKYNVCTMTTDNFNLKCEHGQNSPFSRPEFVDINVSQKSSEKVSEKSSENESQNSNEKKK